MLVTSRGDDRGVGPRQTCSTKLDSAFVTMKTTAHKYPPRPGDGKKDPFGRGADPTGAVEAAISAGLTPDKWHETADGWHASPWHALAKRVRRHRARRQPRRPARTAG